jgi:hypothetical protein
MIWIRRTTLGLFILAVLSIAGIFATGYGPTAKVFYDLTFGAPPLPFNPDDAVAAPDYASEQNWAALPTSNDLADMTPVGSIAAEQGQAPVDVFFVHPTGFLKGSSWTFSMDPDTSTEENTQAMMANLASVYNGCCNVYAPRYRQASIFSYVSNDETIREDVLGFAYQDVERAFEYFLTHFNQGRPFILASHSQGTHHSIRLLRDKIAGSVLKERMVAAYIIGGGLTKSQFDEMPSISLCDSATQTGCAIHWDTFSVAMMEDHEDTDIVCTNPLSWKLDGGLAEKSKHRGAVAGSGEFHMAFSGDDASRGVQFNPLGEPLSNFVEAQCKGGRLYITDQLNTRFGGHGGMRGTYHNLDYPMFHMDIRENAKLRTAAFLDQ